MRRAIGVLPIPIQILMLTTTATAALLTNNLPPTSTLSLTTGRLPIVPLTPSSITSCGGTRRRTKLRNFPSIVRKAYQSDDREGPRRKGLSTSKILRSVLQITNGSFLVAGTTIGGGFLALPQVVAPVGFYQSSLLLTFVWAYFLAQSLILVECILRTRHQIIREGGGGGGGEEDDDCHPGIKTTALRTLGPKSSNVLTLLLVILLQATLVSQLSRAGSIFSPRNDVYYKLGCLVSAAGTAGMVFGPRKGVKVASNANSFLTTSFLASAVGVFGTGVGSADWSRLGPPRGFDVSNGGGSMMTTVLPVFLQLLVYSEIIPTVCRTMDYSPTKIVSSVMIGSFLTLCLQVGWAALGISLVEPGIGGDPVVVLSGGEGPARVPLFCLTITAILTTVLGSYLALSSTAADFLKGSKKDEGSETATKDGEEGESFGWRMKVATLLTLPSALVASTSPTVFLKAIDFCGSYPVLILWGIVPPIMALIQRKRDNVGGIGMGRRKGFMAGPSWWLYFLATMTMGMVGCFAIDDFTSFVKSFR